MLHAPRTESTTSLPKSGNLVLLCIRVPSRKYVSSRGRTRIKIRRIADLYSSEHAIRVLEADWRLKHQHIHICLHDDVQATICSQEQSGMFAQDGKWDVGTVDLCEGGVWKYVVLF